ncbi:kinase-like protein [Rhizopus microsporus]|uniref:Kinase-like protein n=1 Tax=Rhizopus microsporus TaxID=58291 RepID=A0A1X0SB50_RHIZD|nr:kinase-like protein [Rhizopus microsporus]
MSQISHWKSEFYKNGQPKEVIVIEDTPPPDENINKLKYRIEVLPDPTEGAMTRSKRTRAGMQETAVIPASVKRRKMTVNNNNNITAPNIHTTTTTTTTTTSIPQANLIRPILHKPIPTKAPPITQACDDKDGHYIIKPNESLTPRYKIMKLLGQGTFGKVVECYDRVKRNFCAIKIIRAIPKYRDASQSVFDFLKLNDFRPFPIHHIQQFAKQLLTSVAFVHELKLIHTDLKPENILLVNSDYTEAGNMAGMDPKSKILLNTDIRLIDFGSATFEQDYHSTVVSTRHYRAPEIILGMGWSYPCDIWSIGCILVEFLTGDALFQTHDNLEHLAMMEVVLGKIPPELVKLSSPEAQKYFENSKLKYPNANTTKQSKKYVRALKLLQDIVCPSTQPTSNAKVQFLDLLSRMLVYDPNQRTSAREALRHPFFMIQFDEWGRELA